jgi:hypothetical protein
MSKICLMLLISGLKYRRSELNYFYDFLRFFTVKAQNSEASVFYPLINFN